MSSRICHEGPTRSRSRSRAISTRPRDPTRSRPIWATRTWRFAPANAPSQTPHPPLARGEEIAARDATFPADPPALLELVVGMAAQGLDPRAVGHESPGGGLPPRPRIRVAVSPPLTAIQR